MTNWSRYDERQYEYWRRRYRCLHFFAEQLVEKTGANFVLDIGGGFGYIADKVTKYVNVDLNLLAAQHGAQRGFVTHCEDFLTLDIAVLQNDGPFDAVLACNVIEHVSAWETFVDKAIQLARSWALFSFFLGLSDKDKSETVKRGSTVTHHSAAELSRFLAVRQLLSDTRRVIVSNPEEPERSDECLVVCRSETLPRVDAALAEIEGIEFRNLT